MNGFSKPRAHGVPQFTRTSLLGLSKHDLERDSGFSDASSEYLSAVEVTDSEDTGRNGSIFGQEPAGQQVAVVGGSYTGLSPMIIMNNFVLKQPSSMTPSEKQWGFSTPMEVMPQSQVVLLQPMVSNSSSSSSKTGSDNTRQSKSYMPILKSYPRIAPYPADSPGKRVGSSRATETLGRDQRHRRHHHRLNNSPSPLPAQTITNFEAAANKTRAAESREQLHDGSLTLQAGGSSLPAYTDDFRTVTDKYQDPINMDGDKLKRFSNTYNILNKSGLLGITMRTKQLIKENKRTQGQLRQLQEQTALLLDALSSGDPQLWTKLQLSLQDTGKERLGAKAQRVEA
ncbi:CLOCK-interacting pacemaker a [Kryptolebias marmoratus]|uniref:CLOCK-interacting pacemaker a n=1 Tax=Kryptolebias marmoratus TaxID=37003 RepID=A0A3Q3ESY2_KRYMA|nr:CLOCK-interacting pacemaker a [Kryptolebias marmoratus]XP_017273504.1 CLOCK-interacting pacemaker a [Kryptolebias marmoratus]XP_017273512.1 CLOCK-interacting pacemaker a [Kryptolebias marmoratus]XP_017273519.1 CLOCK-interacting pacemaker a [Kryptolebias marmoratus]